MAVAIKLPFFEDQTSVTVAGYSEAGSLLQSSIALTESAVPGLYTGSLSFATFPVGYYDMRVYIGAATVASASWSIRVTADGTTAEYADSIGELRRWATNQTEHDATQAAVAAIEFDPIIAPVIGYADTRIQQTVVPLYIGDTATRSITLVDPQTLEPVNIEDVGLQLVVETSRKGDVKAYTDLELTKVDNVVSFTPTEAMVASERTLNFALKVVVSGHPLAWGIMPVTYVPRSGSS
jgi:hypothetical protein